VLERRAAVARILKARGDALVVTGIGNAASDVAAAGDDTRNMYLAGIMGGAAMLAFGVALAQPKRRVIVITGDGEIMAGIGSLATIGVEAPENLAIAVVDNQVFAATGMQQTHTARGVDIAAIARACGFRAETVNTDTALDSAIPDLVSGCGPYLAVLKVQAKPTPRAPVPRDGTMVARRFRHAATGSDVL
jgi:thiamine pyrophosphate-dependent acetolactate synthase large subunit-like protein